MSKSSKYKVKDPLIDEKHGVFKNKLGMTIKEKLDYVETEYLINTYKKAATEYSTDHTFTVKDICNLHKFFLGEVYEWAGKYRLVDLSSENIRFCHAAFIPNNMQVFSDELL